MKKTIHILFTLVFTVITLGFTINKHYSGGELFSYAIFGEPESCCADLCSCCDEEIETIQFHADYVLSIANFNHDQVELELFATEIPVINVEPASVFSHSTLSDQDLPPPGKQPALSFTQAYLL